jgi:two-component system KDP operon response regulator KdpE
MTGARSNGRILVVDDEESIRRAVGRALSSRGYEVRAVGTGREALGELESFDPELIVLDLNLPDLDGTEVATRVRARNAVPILVLSVREDEEDKIAALDTGADDYLTKPFGTGELLARVRALLRRSAGQVVPAERRFRVDGVVIDLTDRRVERDGEPIHLTRTEWALLDTVSRHPGKLLTHRWLLERVWGPGYGGDLEVLRVFVSQLRHKIEPDPTHPRLLVTDPGIGYRWTVRPSDEPTPR